MFWAGQITVHFKNLNRQKKGIKEKKMGGNKTQVPNKKNKLN